MEASIGFLGAGAMGEALMRGLVQGRLVPAERIFAYDIRRERLKELEDNYGLRAVAGREELVEQANILVLAVKPQNLGDALAGLAVGKEKLVISVIAGVTLSRLASYLGEVPVVRAVPNTPALVGEGMTALAANELVSPEDLARAMAIFRSVGRAIVLPEEQLNAVTGLS
ncbi:MAG: NAD(P)-binding domain-containing protein, partial [Moorella sp. (in: Bacteria)]|nr:NAD(P)-binding domain-containing protein [Moorella sp. (in: firmicutes)]